MQKAPAVSVVIHNWTKCAPKWSRPTPAFVDEHRCYFPVAGEAEMGTPEGSWRMTPGRVYLMPGNRPLWHRCESHFHLHWLHFRLDDLAVDSQLSQQPTRFEWSAQRWDHWQPTWRQLGEPMQDWSAAVHCQVQAMVLDLLADALSQLATAEPDLADPVLVQRLQPAIDFMDAHFRENPPLEDVAASVHLSPVYFHQQFSAAFRQTPHRYMQRKRLQLAREQLLTTDASVSEVGRWVGYDNPFYFSRVFRRHFGLSPQQARKQQRPDTP